MLIKTQPLLWLIKLKYIFWKRKNCESNVYVFVIVNTVYNLTEYYISNEKKIADVSHSKVDYISLQKYCDV